MTGSAKPEPQVMELQGLYGPFQFPELLLQRIWAERSFCMEQARTAAGEPVRIADVGRWNRQGGPDFKGARICVDGRWLHGDVELHLREEDWRAHRHAEDPAYDQVVLHVVLFPPRRTATRGAQGQPLPVLPLLPLLWHDLEEYAADAAIAAIAARPADRLANAWLQMSEAERVECVARSARERWEAKVRYARIRIERLGWAAACHHTALEILGYRFNRAPMLEVASRWPLVEWRQGQAAPDVIFETLRDRWTLQGVRPANHPRKRLRAYAAWTHALSDAEGDWPDHLASALGDWPRTRSDSPEIRTWRRDVGWSGWRRDLMERVGASEWIARPRADNFWGDGLLPLLAARRDRETPDLFPWWFNAWPGDQPASIVRAARLVGLADQSSRRPLAWGHVQALLGWLHASEREATGAVPRRT